MVDDDREWLGQLEAVVAVIRTVGLALSAGLLGAAIFTIASVIRLTAFLHHEEISVLRLVGATEFYIRGPFYAEGMLQGLLGGLVAAGGLWGAWRLVRVHNPGSLLSTLLLGEFLSPVHLVLLVAFGGLAGLVGAVASLRREPL
jgi:cell division transport system permease protein